MNFFDINIHVQKVYFDYFLVSFERVFYH